MTSPRCHARVALQGRRRSPPGIGQTPAPGHGTADRLDLRVLKYAAGQRKQGFVLARHVPDVCGRKLYAGRALAGICSAIAQRGGDRLP